MYNWIVKWWIAQYMAFMVALRENVDIMYCYVKPVELLHADFLAHKQVIDQKLKYNSQQKALASLLNDLFDSTLRRITVITNDDMVDHIYLFRRSEVIQEPERTYAYKRSELPAQKVFVYRRSENVQYADFTVNVPGGLLPDNEAAIRSRIDYYKLAAKTYKINAI